jgi:hypothetical protein
VQSEVNALERAARQVCMPPFPTTKWVARPPWTCLLYLADLHRRRGAGDSNACRWTVNAMRCAAHSEFFDDTVAQHSLRSHSSGSTQKAADQPSARDLKLWIIGRSLDVRATLCAFVCFAYYTRVTPFWGEHTHFSQPQLCWWPFFVFVSAQSMDEWFTGRAKSAFFAALGVDLHKNRRPNKVDTAWGTVSFHRTVLWQTMRFTFCILLQSVAICADDNCCAAPGCWKSSCQTWFHSHLFLIFLITCNLVPWHVFVYKE